MCVYTEAEHVTQFDTGYIAHTNHSETSGAIQDTKLKLSGSDTASLTKGVVLNHRILKTVFSKKGVEERGGIKDSKNL